jgi:uncharacterized protein YdaT
MNKRSQHVVPNPRGGWSVKTAGASRATRVFDGQDEAIRYARDLAKRAHTELYVHRRDGTIRNKNSYGLDPYPPKDRK